MWIRWLWWVRRWVDRQLGLDARLSNLPPVDPGLLSAAQRVVKSYAGFANHSGEYKRDRAYKALIREFPSMERNAIAMAIEVAYYLLRDEL